MEGGGGGNPWGFASALRRRFGYSSSIPVAPRGRVGGRVTPRVRNYIKVALSVCFMKVPVQVQQSPSDRFILVKPFLKPVIGFPKSVI